MIETVEMLEPPVELVSALHPLSFSTTRRELAYGLTITELLEIAGIPAWTEARVYVNGDLVYPEFYRVMRPKRGSQVLVRCIPKGGGGGGRGKNIGYIIGGLVLIIAGIAAAWTGYGAAFAPYAIGTGVSLLLSGVINMLVPQPKPATFRPLAMGNQDQESPTLSIAGQSNNARPYGVVPVVLGTHKIYPPYAARPYTERVGADQYLRLLFFVGLGETETEEHKIGDTDISNFQGVEMEVRTGAAGEPALTLYTNDILEEPLSVLLQSGVAQIRTSATGAAELSVDVAYPQGLVNFAADGTKTATTVSITVEYRLVGQVSFVTAPGSPIVTTDARQALVRDGLRWTVPAVGQYDVRLTRTTADSASTNLIDTSVWSALRTVRLTSPLNFPTDQPVALTALRIKATDQLNGIVDQYNCVAYGRELDWATYAGSVLSDKPLGYWRLGEILGAPTAFDTSGHGRDGVYQGSPALGATGMLVGDAGTSMTCDGTDDKVTTFTGLTAIDLGNSSFTIEAIVSATNLTGNRGIVHKGDGLEFTSGHLGWSLIRAGNVFRFTRAVGSGAPTVADSTTITAGTTYHVIVIYDRGANTARFVLNGAVTGTVSMPSATYSDSFGLEIAQADTGTWQGQIQEVAVYPTALDLTRALAHYAASQGTREWVVQRTSNPASHYRRVLTGSENARALGSSRLDLTALQAWHEENDAGGRSCNLVVDYSTTIYELLQTIAATGRATPTMNDDKHAVVRDLSQTVPRQHFTPRNSRGWKSRRVMVDPIHAIRGRFIDPAGNWQQSERVVYADGYSAAGEVLGTVPATKFEVMDFHGVTDPSQVWRLCRYNMAVAQLRPEVHEFETDLEYLVTRRGDLVRVAHDVLENGLMWARIKSVTTGGGGTTVTTMTVDAVFTMVASSSYVVRIRLSDGTSVLAPITTVAGEQTTVTLNPAVASSPLPAPGDLVLFGFAGLESREVVITRIQPGPDFSARLMVVDAAPAVLTADQGAIPPWDPQMHTQPDLQVVPPTPIIDSVASDETVLLRGLDGSLITRIVIALHYLPTSNITADFLDVRWRRTGSDLPFDSLPQGLPPDTTLVSITAVEDGVAYDLRLRTVTREGQTSPWAEVLNYTVIGKTTPPIAPINLRLLEDGLRWDYPNPPADLDGWLIRMSPGAVGNWQTGIVLHVGVVSAPPFFLDTMYGQWTFMVAAVDTSGNESNPVASLTVNFGDVRLHNQVATNDYDAAGYPGTIVNGSVLAGDLKADQVTTGFWTQDGNLFWSPSGTTLFWQGTYKEMTYSFSYTTAANAAGTTMYFDTTIVAVAWQLFYRVGTSGNYLPWAGNLTGVLGSQVYNFQLVVAAGVVQGVVSRLTLWLDAEDIAEHQSSVATAATTGTRLTLVNTYRSIKQVKPSVVAFGAETAISAIAADKQNTAGAGNGPLIKSYDAAGAVVAGHVDCDITGF